MRLIIRFTIIMALVVASSATASERRLSVDVGIKTSTMIWLCTNSLLMSGFYQSPDDTGAYAQKTTRVGILYGPQTVITYRLLYFSAELLSGNFSYWSGGTSRLNWWSFELGAMHRFPGAAIRATLGQGRFRADFDGLIPAHFPDHVVSELMLRAAVSSVPRARFRYAFGMGFPVSIIQGVFSRKYNEPSGKLVDFQLTVGMRLRRSPIYWDAGFGLWLTEAPIPVRNRLESFRAGLIAKLGYEW